jgi:hypothetical protein
MFCFIKSDFKTDNPHTKSNGAKITPSDARSPQRKDSVTKQRKERATAMPCGKKIARILKVLEVGESELKVAVLSATSNPEVKTFPEE